MQATIKKTLTVLSVIVLTGAVFGYGYYRTKDFLEGPILGIKAPKDGEMFASPLIEVRGISRNLSFLNLDGRKIYTDKDGIWGEKLLLQRGVNIIEVRAKDRFGRENKQMLQVVYDGSEETTDAIMANDDKTGTTNTTIADEDNADQNATNDTTITPDNNASTTGETFQVGLQAPSNESTTTESVR